MNGNARFVLFNGERMRLCDAVRAGGSDVTLECARNRIDKRGWSVERAVTTNKGTAFFKLDEAVRRERELARWRKKSELRKAKARAARALVVAAKGISRTAPEYRKKLRPVGEMSKSELRAMLAQAVHNTAQLAEAAE